MVNGKAGEGNWKRHGGKGKDEDTELAGKGRGRWQRAKELSVGGRAKRGDRIEEYCRWVL